LAVKYVEGVGWVELAGELPTEEEMVKLRALRDSKAFTSKAPSPAEEALAAPLSARELAPTQTEFTPEQIESAGFGGLAQTMRGFQQLEGPPGLLEGMGRAAAAEVVAVPAGLASTLEAGMAATGVEGAGGFEERAARVAAASPAMATIMGLGDGPMFAPALPTLETAREVSRSLAETEQEVRGTPSLRGDGVDAWESFLGGISEGDYRKISEGAAWMAESGASVVPQVITAVASLPLSILTRVGNHAKARAAYRGDDITVADIGLGFGAAGFGAVADKFLGGIGRGAGGRAVEIGRGLAVEGASGAGESILEQVGTREGDGLLLGVDPTTVARAAVTEATAAGLPASLSAALRRPPGEEAYAARSETGENTYASRPAPREQVEADTDVAVRRAEADRALAEQVDAVPTRPRTGEAEPSTTQAQAQAELDQADVDVDTTASDPSASLADVVERQARTAGLHSDANNASNEDTRAFLEEMFPDDPGRVKKAMSQDRVPVSQALAELQARDLHTRTPDDFTAKTTDPFDAMLDDIIATGRNADHVEKLAFGHAKIQHRRVYRNLLREYGKAETQAERNSLAQKIDSVREVSEKIAEANAKAQRAWGLAGRYSQFFLDKDLTLVEAFAKAKVDKGGLELSKAQRDFIEREYAASDKLEARATPMRQGAAKKMRALSRVIRRLEGKASPTKRDAKLLKEAKKRYDRAEGVVVVADHDIRAAKSIRLNAVDKSQAGVILSPTASNAVQDVFDASRALRSSGEDSALGRQGMNLLARSLFTKEQAWIKTIPPALKMLAAAVVNNPAGRASARRLQQGLVDQPYQAVFDLAGGEIADVEGVGGRHGGTLDARQEEFATNLFNRLGGFSVPLVGKVEVGRAIGERLIEPSQNAYALTLNMLRRDYFDRALKKRLAEAGIPSDLSATELVKAVKADPQLLADLESDAYMTNVFTGRGDWRVGTEGRAKGKGAKDIAGVLARRLLYAPKYMASIVENALRTIPSAALTGLLTRRSWTKPLNYKNYPEWFKKIKDREYDPKVLPLVMSGVGPFKDVSDYQRGRLVGEAVFETAWLGSLAALAMIGFGDDEDEVTWRERLRRFNDPESADYRKLVIGNWHISLEGGRGATIRHLMPYGLSQSEADDMAAMDFDVDYSRRIGRMLRNKLHPFVSPLVGVLSNEDYLGEPLTDQEYEEAKDNAYDMLVHLGQRSIPIALAFTPIIAESMGEALGEGMAETGIPGAVPPDPSMADPDAPSLLNRLLITGGTNMFGIGAQYYDPESGEGSLPPELRKLLRGADPARALRPPSLP
jgi:hypothetical protein